MTKYKLVLVPFPFDDLSGSKVRPRVSGAIFQNWSASPLCDAEFVVL